MTPEGTRGAGVEQRPLPSDQVHAIIVGAGPAGSATAILLAERGWRVRLVDKGDFPREHICGEYLSPEAARLLDRLGVLKEVDRAGVPLHGMLIVAPDGTRLEASYPTEGPWRGYRDHALAVRRTALDALLVDRARTLPVDVRLRHRVTDLTVEGDRVTGVRGQDAAGHAFSWSAPLVVGADGRASVVARALGLVRPHRLRRLALVRHVEGLEGLEGRGEIYVDPPDYAILNPVAPGLVNLAVVVPLAHARPHSGRLDAFLRARIAAFRHLGARVAGMRPAGPLMAMAPLAYRVADPRHHQVALVGDATGFYDPFTGEGVFTALRSAELLAETAHAALGTGDTSRGSLAGYVRSRRAAFRGKAWLTRAVHAALAGRRRADLVAHFLARRPALLGALLGAVGDIIPPGALLRPSVLGRLLSQPARPGRQR